MSQSRRPDPDRLVMVRPHLRDLPDVPFSDGFGIRGMTEREVGVGTISAWYNRDFHGEDYGRIHWVAVRPAFQGKGLGKAGLSYAMKRLAEWHDRCCLVASRKRIAAVQLYRKFGFEEVRDE